MKIHHLKKTLITMTALALAQSAAIARNENGEPQTVAQKPQVPDAGPKTVVVGGSTGFGISYLPLLVMEDKKTPGETCGRAGAEGLHAVSALSHLRTHV